MTKPTLAATMQDLLTVSENDPAWPAICADIGFPKLREIIMTLRYAYAANYCGSGAELANAKFGPNVTPGRYIRELPVETSPRARQLRRLSARP